MQEAPAPLPGSVIREAELLGDGGTRSPEQGFPEVAKELRGRPRPWQIPGAPSARRSC